MVTKKLISDVMKDISLFGSLIFFLFFSIVIYLFGYIREFYLLIVSLFLIYLISSVIRIIFYKDRPEKQTYSGLLSKIDSSSFPSIHSTRITFLTFFVFINFGINLGLLMSFISILVYFSRIYLKKHYLADVLGGIVIGIVLGILIL